MHQLIMDYCITIGRQLYLDVVGVSEEHGKTIDAHPPAGSWWQSVFQCSAEGLINEHGFIVTLSFVLKSSQLKLLTRTDKPAHTTKRSLNLHE